MSIKAMEFFGMAGWVNKKAKACVKNYRERHLSDERNTWMRGFLINKNLCLYYWLKKKVGKIWAFRVAIRTEKVILILGRPHVEEYIPKEDRRGGRK